MLKLLADENFDRHIIRGLMRRKPETDIVRVQDVGLRTLTDEVILAWAANNQRVLVTHDAATVAVFAYERVDKNWPMPGVIEVRRSYAIGEAIDDLLLVIECAIESELSNTVLYIPL